jgi:hypothetical protein
MPAVYNPCTGADAGGSGAGAAAVQLVARGAVSELSSSPQAARTRAGASTDADAAESTLTVVSQQRDKINVLEERITQLESQNTTCVLVLRMLTESNAQVSFHRVSSLSACRLNLENQRVREKLEILEYLLTKNEETGADGEAPAPDAPTTSSVVRSLTHTPRAT